MFDVKGVDIKIEISALEDFNTIKDHYNLIRIGMQDIATTTQTHEPVYLMPLKCNSSVQNMLNFL